MLRKSDAAKLRVTTGRIRDEDIRCVTGECKRVGNGNVKQDTEK